MPSSVYKPFWREKFEVRSYDVGVNSHMRMSHICHYFQEVAGKHANHLDVGYDVMHQSDRVWVLSRLFIQVNKLPQWGQEFYVETWPLGTERIFYRRDYRIDDGTNTLVSATSYWILLDLKLRKPSFVSLDENVLKTNAGRFAMPMPSERFPAVFAGDTFIHRVKYSDLDNNRHVNNARYVEWVFDLFDCDELEKNTPSFFAIEYKHEVKANDTVVLRKERLDNGKPVFAIEGVLQGSEQVCVRSKVAF